ncbi:Uncharacterized protein PCOAH_00013840 [Plasmodium coatneyi]|uniref:Uncharacterized protein n=1 Tax=Plasmodium coatneyi TaxID=208452 RepID=A0A1B1DX00_9APIC|nr:Uncharacterized protein PCOAH_00013840 [Plasmodium coatneyi]ANQ07137.1 Uncharacterized protein PCOAH_00013840 [Plasmodium coatneyi]
MKELYLVYVSLLVCLFFTKRIINEELLSVDRIRHTMRNYSVMDESKGFSNFALLYLYNALRCTLTQDVFESHEDEKYRKAIFLVKHNLLRLRQKRADRNVWLFFEFDLMDLLLSATAEIEANMRNYDMGLLEMYNELRLSDFTFNRVSNLEMDICTNHIFSVEEVSLHMTVVPFLLEEADITTKLYTQEMRQALWKTLNFFNFFMLQMNEHNITIANIYKKEINVFLKVVDKFDFISVNDENILELHDEIHLKKKYGKKLLRNFFIFLNMFLFYQVPDESEYFHYIEVVPIYIRTKKGTMKSRNYNMENIFYPLVERVYKNDLKINEGILLIRILKQYNIESHTKRMYYYNSDFIYKSIIYESVLSSSSELSSGQSGVIFEPLYSQNIDMTKGALTPEEDITLSLILLVNTDTHVDVLLEQIHNFVFPKDIFLANLDSNKERIKIMGSCIYTKESQPPIFQGFFSRGLSTYILFKILDLLKPNKKLLYLSIDKAEDNKNQIASEKIAERIMNVTQGLYEVVLLFERDDIINFDKFEHSDECDMCLLGYRGLYTLYVCIFIPILVSILICYYIYKRKIGAQGNSAVRKIAVFPNQVKSIEPNIVTLQL